MTLVVIAGFVLGFGWRLASSLDRIRTQNGAILDRLTEIRDVMKANQE